MKESEYNEWSLHHSYKENLKGRLFKLWEKRLQRNFIHTFRCQIQKMDPDTSHWYLVAGEDAMGKAGSN